MILPPDALVIPLLVVATTAAAVIDARTRRVPNAITVPVAIAGICLSAGGLGRVGVVASMAGCALGLLLMLPTYGLGATGAGDVKLFAAAGTLLGPEATLFAFFYTAMAGGAIALAVAMTRRTLGQTLMRTAGLATGSGKAIVDHPASNNRFAYASAIAIGTMLAAWRA